MKRIVRLTESDLVRLVKRVISEQAAKGPEFSTKEANYLKMRLNKGGVEYLSADFKVLVPFEIVFFVSPIGSSKQMAYTGAEQKKEAQTTTVAYQKGDSLNVIESDYPEFSRNYSGIQIKVNGQPLTLRSGSSDINALKGFIQATQFQQSGY